MIIVNVLNKKMRPVLALNLAQFDYLFAPIVYILHLKMDSIDFLIIINF